MPKSFHFYLFFLWFLLFMPTPVILAADQFPTIVIDEAHLDLLQLKRIDGTQPIPYEIKESQGLMLDAGSYDFPLNVRKVEPNTIQVMIQPDQQFELEWEAGKKKYILSKDTLKPLKGSKPFDGFQKGKTIIIGIGRVKGNKGLNVFWAGKVNVR